MSRDSRERLEVNADRHLARSMLTEILGELKDPSLSPNPVAAEEALKKAVRACWKQREHFPSWIHGYIERWKADGKG